MIQTKPNRCKHCKARLPADMARHVLHPECIDPWVTIQREKQTKARIKAEKVRQVKEKRETKKALEKFKTPTQWEEECRKIVQEIARLRDRHDGCISCHVGPNYGGRWNGSHFRPAGNNAAVQFHLWNIHKACAQCNLFKGGNISAYRPRLVEKIGADRVAWLESQNQPVKTNVVYLVRFKAVMGKRLLRMKKRITKEFA